MDFKEQIKILEEGRKNWQTKKYKLLAKESTATINEQIRIEDDLKKCKEKIDEIDEEIKLLNEQNSKTEPQIELKQEIEKPSQQTTCVVNTFTKKSKESEAFDLYIQRGNALNFNTNTEDYNEFLKIKDEFNELIQLIGNNEEKLIDSSLIYKNEKIYYLTDKIIFNDVLTKEEEQEINAIRTEYREDKKRFAWYERSMIISALTLSLAHNKFDVKKASLLLEFITENEEKEEEQNWQRALVGLVLVLCKYHNKIIRYNLFISKLKDLQNIPRIQEGLVKIEEILRNQYYKEAQNFNLNNIKFFEKPQNWFVPFHKEHELFKQAIENADSEVDIKELEEYLERIPFKNAYKFAVCLAVKEKQIKEFPPKSSVEKQNWKKMNERLLKLSFVFFPFHQLINEWDFFFSSFSHQKFNNLLAEKVTIYETKLTNIILSQNNKNKFSAALDIKNKRWSVALTKLEKVLVNNPSDSEVLYQSAICHSELKHFKEAIKYWEQLEKFHPENPFSTVNIGICYYHQNNYKKALKYLIKDKKPIIENDKQLLFIIGNCYEETGEFERAITVLKVAEQLDKNNVKIKKLISNCFWELRNFQECLNYLLEINQLNPNDFNNIKNICGVYCMLKDYENGEKYGLIAEKINRNGDLTNLANVYVELKNIEKAKLYYEHSLKVEPHNSHILWIVSLFYFTIGNLDRAKELVSKSLEIKFYLNAAFIFSGIEYCEGNRKEALDAYKLIVNKFNNKDLFLSEFDKLNEGFEKNGVSKDELEQLKVEIFEEDN